MPCTSSDPFLFLFGIYTAILPSFSHFLDFNSKLLRFPVFYHSVLTSLEGPIFPLYLLFAR